MELRNRYTKPTEALPTNLNVEEALVSDVRGRLTPAQIVEQKLRSVLPVMTVRRAERRALSAVGPQSE
jgi:hypothetical protein